MNSASSPPTIIGGVKLTGGRGSIFGVLLGLCVIGIFQNLIVLWGVSPNWTQGVLGSGADCRDDPDLARRGNDRERKRLRTARRRRNRYGPKRRQEETEETQ